MRRETVAAALLLLAACTITPSRPDGTGTTPATPGATTAPPTTSSPPQTSRPVPNPGGTIGGAAPPASTTYPELAAVGAMAKTYLKASPAKSLVVEVDWMSGRKPGTAALAHLESILKRELDKPGGVDVRLGEEMATSRTSWTVDDLVAAEKQFRAEHSGGSRVTMWIGYVGGEFAEGPSALAAAFAASAAAVFRDRIAQATSAVLLASEIERSVLVHEAGHLLGLVNIGYTSRFDHEDAQHPNHSNNPDSVMYWAVEDVSIKNLLGGGPPSDFDQADRADLAMLRSE